MFLFEVKPRLEKLPPAHREGEFDFFPPAQIASLKIPQTDAGANLAVVLAASRRIFRRALPMPRPRAAINGPWRKPSRKPMQMPGRTDHRFASDHYFMGEALRQAARAYEAEEVPVGAVIVREGRIIARAYNQVELLKDATAHAEMLALTQAEEAVGDWRLTDCTFYVTKEPCPMCAGAMVHVRLARVVFGAGDPKAARRAAR